MSTSQPRSQCKLLSIHSALETGPRPKEIQETKQHCKSPIRFQDCRKGKRKWMRSAKTTGPNGDEFQLIDKHMPSLDRILKKKIKISASKM